MPCRIRRTSEWALRITHELESCPDAVFVTLTYDNDHLPDNYSVSKRELQLFLKRLRKNLKGKKIRYYACGEYGEKRHRPHYHLCIFGIKFEREHYEKVGKYYLVTRGPLFDSWRKGGIQVGDVTYDSASYVAGYLNKKLVGPLGKEKYEKVGREAPFQIQSQGLGRDYVDKYAGQLRELGYLTYRGKSVPIPRYYRNRADLNPEIFREFRRRATLEAIKYHTQEFDVGTKTRAIASNTLLELSEESFRKSRLAVHESIKTRINMRNSMF